LKPGLALTDQDPFLMSRLRYTAEYTKFPLSPFPADSALDLDEKTGISIENKVTTLNQIDFTGTSTAGADEELIKNNEQANKVRWGSVWPGPETVVFGLYVFF
jgi:hypothetical protein